jgi:LCP family protein required for cell wall assembly
MGDRGRHFAAPHRGHRSWGQRIFLGMTSIVTVAVFLGAGAVVYVYERFGEIVRFSEDETPVDVAPPGEPENFLIVGSDSRENVDPDDPAFADVLPGVVAGTRTDTIMVARIDPEETRIQMLSFPRDLWVPITGYGQGRINEAYGHGRDVLIDTIRDNFGITVNHYIEVDFTGFQRLVGAIGGVPVYLDAQYRDNASGLGAVGPGCVTLEGEQALAFARARHLERREDADDDWDTDPTGDLGRITRQQFLIREAIAKVVTLNPFTNPLTMTNLLDVAVESIGVDHAMSNDDIRDLVAQFEGFDPESIQNYALPTDDFRTPAGAAVLRLQDGAEPIFNIFRGLEAGEVLASQVTVDVQNGTGVERQAANTAEALAAVGFVTVVEADPEAVAATTVRYAPGSEAAAQLVARHLTSQAVFEVDEGLGLNEVTLVTGPDFTTVVRQPWAVEAVPAPTTTTTAPPATTPSTLSGSTTTTEPPATTTTTAIGFLPEAPDGTTC